MLFKKEIVINGRFQELERQPQPLPRTQGGTRFPFPKPFRSHGRQGSVSASNPVSPGKTSG